MSTTPTIRLSRSGTPVVLSPKYFSDTTDGAPAQSWPIRVEIAFEAQRSALVVRFDCGRDPYVDQNTYTVDNSDMWNQEVCELFISAGPEVPHRYMELEINPNGALFSAHVTNPNGRGTHNILTDFDGHAKGIETKAVKTQDAWSGEIEVPLTLAGPLQSTYRFNLFRVVSHMPHDVSEDSQPWACTPDTCAYLAWSPTYSGPTPAFHIPAYFGLLELDDE